MAADALGENLSITKENHMDIDTHDELETGLETKAGRRGGDARRADARV